jgi:phosphopantetheine adenylyltransferase/dephospho-CoA kinase
LKSNQIELGAAIIDCDKLGHRAYVKGTTCYDELIREFGTDIVRAEDGEIDRRALGSKVFGSPEKLARLNALVWPAIAALVNEELARLRKADCQVRVKIKKEESK